MSCIGTVQWEYHYYDNATNGDLHDVLPGKFIAFRGPSDTPCPDSFSLQPSQYNEVFKVKNVSTIIRLNERSSYQASHFVKQGLQHYDLEFRDCSIPPDHIVDKFLRISETVKGVIAVHCLAGLGRTGTLIALYLMKHKGFAAREAIAWLRICRPGSVIGPQQAYLVAQEARMHQLGQDGVAGLGADVRRVPSSDLDTRVTADSGRLADMVADGMRARDKNHEIIVNAVSDGMLSRVTSVPLADIVAVGMRAHDNHDAEKVVNDVSDGMHSRVTSVP